MNRSHWLLSIAFVLSLGFSKYSFSQSLSTEIETLADIVIDINGTGDYTSVKEGISAVPDNSTETTIIFVKNGIYQEKVILGHTKHNVILVGEDADSTIITWDDYGDKMLPGGHTFSTYTFRADPHGFQAYNIQFNNPTIKGQGVAFHSNGDKQILYHCRLTGNQDTYFDNFRTRRLIKDSYIEGTVDFIFGFGVTLFDSCQINNISSGYVTASSTPQYYEFGHVFKDCRITTGKSVSGAYLGRPWFPYANTTFFTCWLSDGINAKGWYPWSGREATCIYNEYNCFGPGSDTTARVYYGKQLDPDLAPRYTIDNIMSASNFPSDMGEVVDSVELWSMRNRFENSGYADRADTILFAGREYWPEYPKDDWTPEYDAKVKSIIDKYTVPFMDSANYNTKIADISVEGLTLDFDPDVKDYVIELDQSVTDIPSITVIPEDPKTNVEIEYPEKVPGIITINVSSHDRSHFDRYTIYNSVGGSYNNALLDSILLKGIAIPNFDPEVFEYDFVLPQGSSKYFSVKFYKQVEDATHKLVKLKTLPGEMSIAVTSLSGVVTNVYKINVTVSTGIEDEILSGIALRHKSGTLICTLGDFKEEELNICLHDIGGKSVFEKEFVDISNNQELKIPLELPEGVYVYRISTSLGETAGKLLIE